jgi:hypothetical protein
MDNSRENFGRREITLTLFMTFCLALSGVLSSCKDKGTEPGVKITSVDQLLLRACELASDCVSATPEQIAACPADLRLELMPDDIAELERFTTLDKATQDRILECFDAAICGRFGGNLANISDADLMEPLGSCE